MKILIAGANGFIGSHLCRVLVQGGYEIGVVCSATSNLAKIEGLISLGVCRDSGIQSLLKFLESRRFDGVINLAAYYAFDYKPASVDRFIESNISLGVHLLEVAAASGIPWFLTIGTTWQNFKGAQYDPVDLYAATKKALQDIMRYYVSSGKLTCGVLKFTDTYGADDARKKVLPLWKKVAKTGELLLMSPGEQYIDLLHVSDVVEAIIAVILILEKSSIGFYDYVISSEKQLTLKELAGMVERIAGVRLNIHWGGRPYRTREVMMPAFIGNPVPGWSPRIPLEDGVREFFCHNDYKRDD